MLIKIAENLYGFIWDDTRQNNCNTYLMTGRPNIIIDPGHRRLVQHVHRGLASLRIAPEDIGVVIATHCHPDHFEAARSFGRKTLFGMGAKEYGLVGASGYLSVPTPDFLIQEGELVLGETRFTVIETPGHSPASICLFEPGMRALFAGDVVFENGIGRSDLPGGDGAALKKSIQALSRLNAAYLLSGHGTVVAGNDAVAANFRVVEESWFRYL